jgi:UDP-4-amino-4,6-dideoxy-N-acetyl-beta-L-altrosamine transaminase
LIPYGRQDINDDDIAAVADVLRSDFLTQGPLVPAFEAALANYCGVRHAIGVNSATSALHIACLALGLGEGDWLWTTPISFVASANCGIYCGAKIDFVDIDPRSFNMCPRALEVKLEAAKQRGCPPKIVVPVHLAGQSCDMKAIHALSQRYGFSIIEDASHAVGASYAGEKVGSCRYSDVTVFSFHPVKIITTGEGGIALTNDAALAQQMQLLRSHGVTRDDNLMQGKSHGTWYYQQVALGFNYRMTDIQAALGLSQLKRLDAFIAARHRIVARYEKLLTSLPLSRPWQHPDTVSSFHLYIVELDRRAAVYDHLRNVGIGVNVHYIPIHTQPFYQAMGFKDGDLPAAEAYYSRALTLPIHPNLTEAEQDHVVAALREALG